MSLQTPALSSIYVAANGLSLQFACVALEKERLKHGSRTARVRVIAARKRRCKSRPVAGCPKVRRRFDAPSSTFESRAQRVRRFAREVRSVALLRRATVPAFAAATAITEARLAFATAFRACAAVALECAVSRRCARAPHRVGVIHLPLVATVESAHKPRRWRLRWLKSLRGQGESGASPIHLRQLARRGFNCASVRRCSSVRRRGNGFCFVIFLGAGNGPRPLAL